MTPSDSDGRSRVPDIIVDPRSALESLALSDPERVREILRSDPKLRDAVTELTAHPDSFAPTPRDKQVPSQPDRELLRGFAEMDGLNIDQMYDDMTGFAEMG